MINSSFTDVITNRQFRYLWLGQITSQIALNMLIFVLGIHVYQETTSNISVSLMFLAFTLPAIIFGVVAGGIVDHFDKRKILLLCNFSRVILFLSFFFFANNLIALYFISILISIMTQLFIPAEATAIPSLVSEDKLLTANSLFTITYYLSTVVGFIIAGPMIDIFGYDNIFLLQTALMMLATFFVYRLPSFIVKKDKDFSVLSFASIGKTIDEGIQFINSNIRIKQSIVLITLSQALIATLSVLAPGFADRVLAIKLTDASYLVMGPAALGLVFGALWIGKFGIKFLKGSIIMAGIFISGITLMLLSILTKADSPVFSLLNKNLLVNNIWFAFFFLFLLGMSNSFIIVPANTILQEDTLSNLRGRVFGVLTSAMSGISFLPVVFSGVLADTLGVGKTLFILGIILLFIGFYYYMQRRKTISSIKY